MPMASPDQRDPSAPFRFDLFLDLAINFYAAPGSDSATHIESPKTKGQTRLNDGFFNFQPSNLSLENKSIPAFYYLNHNFPNPFNPTTRITYSLPKKTLVSIIIYEQLGKKVNTLIDKELQEPGTKTVQWHGKNQEGLSLSSGVYFYSLETKDFLQKKKMILIK